MKRNWLILIALLALQGALVARSPGRAFGGDEHHYIVKAGYLREHGALPQITAEQRAAEAGAFAYSDWRPPGYSLFLAAAGGGDYRAEVLRPRMAMVHFALMAAAVLTAFAITGATLPAALVLGIAPWPFAFVTTIGPDSPNAALSFFGLALLVRATGWCAAVPAAGTAASRAAALGDGAPGRRPASRRDAGAPLWFGGSLLLAATLLLRAEMIAVALVTIAVALLIARARRRAWVAATLAFALVVGAQYAYRAYFVGAITSSLFGTMRIHDAGAYAWANSWLGTEKEAYDFVYGLNDHASVPLPARAFASEAERAEVERLLARVRAEGWSKEIDDSFFRLAETRRRAHPFEAALLPRLWHTAHLWINLETNDQLLHALAEVPRALRRSLLALLMLLKLALLAAFVARLIQLIRKPSPAMVMASFTVARTVLIGLVLNRMGNRFMVSAWLPLLVTVLYYYGRNPASPGVAAER